MMRTKRPHPVTAKQNEVTVVLREGCPAVFLASEHLGVEPGDPFGGVQEVPVA